jgi:16S rRNA (cytidine1402-2'-O)-methyltransferase
MEGLIIVPTPIGNLKDITLRSIEVLREVNLVLAEDTRTSGQLFKHLEIEAKFFPFHIHNEHKTLEGIIEKLKSGLTIALVSDAGTPGISDPGYLLIRECIKENIKVECLPGATAFTPALVVSGFPTDRFCFEGFLPHKKGRQSRLEELKDESRTIIFYESPHRLLKSLNQFKDYFGSDRLVSVSREISKKFEETIRGTVDDVTNHFTKNEPRGEFVIVISGKEKVKIKKKKYNNHEEE